MSSADRGVYRGGVTEPNFHIVLFQPEIPQNTGNIGRTCVGTGCHLHLIEPLGFEITDKHLKRSGLDYWPHLTWKRYPNLMEWQSQHKGRVFYFSKKAERSYTDVAFEKGDAFVFGPETKGLPEDMLRVHDAHALKMPLYGPIRSLNLATAVAVAIYEGLRQLGLPG